MINWYRRGMLSGIFPIVDLKLDHLNCCNYVNINTNKGVSYNFGQIAPSIMTALEQSRRIATCAQPIKHIKLTKLCCPPPTPLQRGIFIGLLTLIAMVYSDLRRDNGRMTLISNEQLQLILSFNPVITLQLVSRYFRIRQIPTSIPFRGTSILHIELAEALGTPHYEG